MEIGGTVFDLPGFRFHPTEEELLNFYLRHKTLGKKLSCEIISTIQLYRHEPWDLPKLSMVGEREWYFFVPRDRVQVSGKRPNRTTVRGFWKATGTDRTIRSSEDPKRLIGYKKTLVFYTGRAPRGCKTGWVMNEYRLPSIAPASSQEDIVLCKVYRKATSLKELEQRAAMEEEKGGKARDSVSEVTETFSSPEDQGCIENCVPFENGFEDVMDEVPGELINASSSSFGPVSLPEIRVENQNFDSMLQPFPSQLQSPWMEDWSAYAEFLDF